MPPIEPITVFSNPTTLMNGINTELGSILQRFNFAQVASQATQAQDTFGAMLSSSLGVQINQIISGFQAVTAEVDLEPFTDAFSQISSVFNRGIVQLVSDPGGINITTAAPQFASDLSDFFGEDLGPGFLKMVVTANTPQAMGRVLENVAGANLNQITSALSGIFPQAAGAINQALSNVTGLFQEGFRVIQAGLNLTTALSSQIDMFTSSVSNALNQGFVGTISNAMESVTGQFEGAINSITEGFNLPREVDLTVRRLIQESAIGEAVQTLQNYSNFPAAVIEGRINELNASLHGALNTITEPLNNIARVISPNTTTGLSGAFGTPAFTGGGGAGGGAIPSPSAADANANYIGTDLELQAIFNSATRDITTAVVGATFTGVDEEVLAADVTGWHFLITRGGRIQPMLPINSVGSFDRAGAAVGVIFAGGTNKTRAALEGIDPADAADARGFTRQQWNAFDRFLKTFFDVWPHGQVIGMANLPFDPVQYAQTRFRKAVLEGAAGQPFSAGANAYRQTSLGFSNDDPDENGNYPDIDATSTSPIIGTYGQEDDEWTPSGYTSPTVNNATTSALGQTADQTIDYNSGTEVDTGSWTPNPNTIVTPNTSWPTVTPDTFDTPSRPAPNTARPSTPWYPSAPPPSNDVDV